YLTCRLASPRRGADTCDAASRRSRRRPPTRLARRRAGIAVRDICGHTRDGAASHDAASLRMEDLFELSHGRRRARTEVHDFGLVDTIDLAVLSRRREIDARQLPECLDTANAIESDVGRQDDIRRRPRDDLQ